MDEHELDRRSVLGTSGALAGAAALGFLPTGSAVSSQHPESHDDGPITTTSGTTEPRHELGEAEVFYVDVELTFETDGEETTETPTLYGEIIRPVDDGGETVDDVPVILTYSPYNDLYQALNGGESPALDRFAEFFVPRGYARAQFDLIGTRNSGGYYDYGGIRERLSGAELVDALGGMAWSNGNVGMIGASYDGTTQLAAAIEAPDHLEAVVPQAAIDRWYDYRYIGGCPRNTYGTPTLFDFGFALVPPAADDPVHDVDATATRLEPGSRVEHEVRSYEYDPVYDDFWRERDYRRRADEVECAVMMEAGWEDRNVLRWGSTRFYEALPEAVDGRLLVGDWAHATASYPDIEDLYHAWFDHWLVDGVETDVMDLPSVDVQSASSPRTQFGNWPADGAEEVVLPLVRSDADEGELELVGTGLATWQDRSPPVTEAEMFDERGSGDRYLTFESVPLEDRLRVSGRVTADLLAASGTDTWYAAVLYERRPDGSIRIFARGARNSLFRRGDEAEPRETPTEGAYRVPVECWDIDWTVGADHRLGLVVASDNEQWVRHDPSNQGRNQLVLGDSTLRVDGFVGGVDAPTFPTVELTRESDTQVYTAGRAGRIRITADAATGQTLVRDRLPAGWDVVAGDQYSTYEVDGATYVEFADAIDEGESLTYFAEAPEETGEYQFGPLEHSAAGDLWATVADTEEVAAVVGADASS